MTCQIEHEDTYQNQHKHAVQSAYGMRPQTSSHHNNSNNEDRQQNAKLIARRLKRTVPIAVNIVLICFTLKYQRAWLNKVFVDIFAVILGTLWLLSDLISCVCTLIYYNDIVQQQREDICSCQFIITSIETIVLCGVLLDIIKLSQFQFITNISDHQQGDNSIGFYFIFHLQLLAHLAYCLFCNHHKQKRKFHLINLHTLFRAMQSIVESIYELLRMTRIKLANLDWEYNQDRIANFSRRRSVQCGEHSYHQSRNGLSGSGVPDSRMDSSIIATSPINPSGMVADISDIPSNVLTSSPGRLSSPRIGTMSAPRIDRSAMQSGVLTNQPGIVSGPRMLSRNDSLGDPWSAHTITSSSITAVSVEDDFPSTSDLQSDSRHTCSRVTSYPGAISGLNIVSSTPSIDSVRRKIQATNQKRKPHSSESELTRHASTSRHESSRSSGALPPKKTTQAPAAEIDPKTDRDDEIPQDSTDRSEKRAKSVRNTTAVKKLKSERQHEQPARIFRTDKVSETVRTPETRKAVKVRRKIVKSRPRTFKTPKTPKNRKNVRRTRENVKARPKVVSLGPPTVVTRSRAKALSARISNKEGTPSVSQTITKRSNRKANSKNPPINRTINLNFELNEAI